METLPTEIILQILEYLPFDDRRATALVNRAFYNASSHPVFSKKEWLTYKPLEEVDLKKSKRHLFCLKINDLTFIDDLTLFKNLGNQIISLHFHNLKLLNDSFLNAIIYYCKNLEELELIELKDLFITDKKNRDPILKLRSITLHDVQITDKEFNIILKLAPNLKDLCIIKCNINYKSQIIRRFYPQSKKDDLFNNFNSELIFSDKNIVRHLNNSVYLNSLKLNQCCNILYQIQPSRNELQSLVLSFDEIDMSKNPSFKILSEFVSLRQLEIYRTHINLLSTISKLYNLRLLKISYYIPSDESLNHCLEVIESFKESLKQFKHIKTLYIYRVLDSFLEVPIPPLPDCILPTLTSLSCSFDPSLKPLLLCKNLTKLRIGNGNILEVDHLQLLFKEFINLKHLRIDHCVKVNDSNFNTLPISNLKGLITLKIMGSNVSYLSLRHITNPSLKVLVLNNVAFDVTVMKEVLDSLIILSTNIPMLNELSVSFDNRKLQLLGFSPSHYYFDPNFEIFVKKLFKRLKKIKLRATFV